MLSARLYIDRGLDIAVTGAMPLVTLHNPCQDAAIGGSASNLFPSFHILPVIRVRPDPIAYKQRFWGEMTLRQERRAGREDSVGSAPPQGGASTPTTLLHSPRPYWLLTCSQSAAVIN